MAPSTAYSPASTSCLTHHCLDSILNLLPPSPTGWFNVRASLPPCLACCARLHGLLATVPSGSLHVYSAACLLQLCCLALPHPCCLEHGLPPRPFPSLHLHSGDLSFSLIVSMVTSLAPLSLRQPQVVVSSVGVLEIHPTLLLGLPSFLPPESHTCSRGTLLCAACSVTGDSLLGMVVIPQSPLHDSMCSFVATLALVPVPILHGEAPLWASGFSGSWQPLGLPAWLR